MISRGVLASAFALSAWALAAPGQSDPGELENCCDHVVNFGFSEHAIQDGPVFAGILGLGEGCMAREGEVIATAGLGEVNTKSLFVNIISNLPDGANVQGWSLGVRLEGEGAITRATLAGTAADVMPNGGYRDPEGSFKWTGVIDPAKNGGRRGVVTAVALTTQGLAEAVLPSVGTQSVLAFDVSSEGPQGETDQTAVLRFGVSIPGLENQIDELTTVQGNSVYPCNARTARLSVTFHAPRFRRGDANSSGKVDISDAIRIFMTLFQGAEPFPCADAADATDDGRTDISDGLRILLDFFIPGTAIPTPGPFACGLDPTPDDLSCLEEPPC